MKINDFFQKGYYINLDRRPDRRELFEQEVSGAGLSGFFERHAGVEDMAAANVTQAHEPETIKKGLCCGKAFHNVFKKMQSDGVERAIVCEDDMYFLSGGQAIIERALDQLQQFPDWDMIYFGGLVIDPEARQVSENLLRVNTVLTMHAIGYNKRALDVLLKYKPFIECVYDGWVGERKDLVKYMVYPAAVIQREGTSDIDASGNSLSNKHWEDSYARIKLIK